MRSAAAAAAAGKGCATRFLRLAKDVTKGDDPKLATSLVLKDRKLEQTGETSKEIFRNLATEPALIQKNTVEPQI